MLQQFSWGQFLIAAALLSVLWYLFAGLLFYSKELKAFLGIIGDDSSGKEMRAGTVKPARMGRGGLRNLEIEYEVNAALMGSSRLPDGVEVKSSGQLSFAVLEADRKYDQVGLVADVVQELKLVFSELEKSAGDKRDFFRLLEKVKEEYGPLGDHPSVGALTAFIVESASFHLTAGEVENLWY